MLARIEQVGNLSSAEIIEYANSDRIANGSEIFRFYEPNLDVFFYTASERERSFVEENLDNYEPQGQVYTGAPHDEDLDSLTGAKPVYRFLNVDAGVHVYTIAPRERDSILENLPNYNYEGVAYYGFETEQPGTIPVYRFLNTNTGTHFYTTSVAERDDIAQNAPNYQLEGDIESGGITFYVPEAEI